MNSVLTSAMIKYLILGVVVFALFKYVPKNPMPDRDIILLTIIVVLAYGIIEHFYPKSESTSPSCNTTCSVNTNEHMIDLNAIAANLMNTNAPSISPSVTSTVAPLVARTTQPMPTYNPDVNALLQSVQVPVTQVPVTQYLANQYQYTIPQNTQTRAVGSRVVDDVITNEMKYSYTDYNTLPISENTGSFEYGYSFLPPEKWYPVPPNPPVCVTEKSCPVCPIYTEGTNVDLKEWNQSRRITPADQINVNYIQEKLNSGR